MRKWQLDLSCLPVRLSARNNSAPTGRIFKKFDIWWFFENLSKKIQVSSKSDKNNGYFTWRTIHIFYHISPHFFLEWEMFQTNVVEKIRTHILCSITFFLRESCLYEIILKNIVEQGRAQMTIWRMLIACWTTKATNTHTHTQYVILIAFAQQQWLHERASTLRYTYICFSLSLLYDGT